jgi:hypothetical protein
MGGRDTVRRRYDRMASRWPGSWPFAPERHVAGCGNVYDHRDTGCISYILEGMAPTVVCADVPA